MFRAFGFLIAISFCDFEFLKRDFRFLKTTPGRGWFDLFCASMFLITADGGVTGWIMFSILVICGGFFVMISFQCGSDAEVGDISSNDLKAQGG